MQDAGCGVWDTCTRLTLIAWWRATSRMRYQCLQLLTSPVASCASCREFVLASLPPSYAVSNKQHASGILARVVGRSLSRAPTSTLTQVFSWAVCSPLPLLLLRLPSAEIRRNAQRVEMQRGWAEEKGGLRRAGEDALRRAVDAKARAEEEASLKVRANDFLLLETPPHAYIHVKRQKEVEPIYHTTADACCFEKKGLSWNPPSGVVDHESRPHLPGVFLSFTPGAKTYRASDTKAGAVQRHRCVAEVRLKHLHVAKKHPESTRFNASHPSIRTAGADNPGLAQRPSAVVEGQVGGGGKACGRRTGQEKTA